MRKVKVIQVFGHYVDDYDINYTFEDSEWDEVSDETFEMLKNWIMHENQKPDYGSDEHYYLLATPNEIPIKKMVADYVEIARKEEEEKAKIKEAKDKAKLEREKKKAEKKREKELATLAELEQKYKK